MKEYILTNHGTLAADMKVLSTRVKTFLTGGFESDWEKKTGSGWQE